MRVKNYKKNMNKLNFQSSLPEVFFKTLLEPLFESDVACNFVYKRTPSELFSYNFCEFSRRLLLSIAIICQEYFKLNMRRITYLLILMTSA